MKARASMGKFFVRFSDLLTPSERERLAELTSAVIALANAGAALKAR
jgi:hypothetical protein